MSKLSMSTSFVLAEAGDDVFRDLQESLREFGVSDECREALRELTPDQLRSIVSAQDLTAVEELGIEDNDARRVVAVLETLKGRERGPLLFLDVDGVLNRTAMATHVRVDSDLCGRLQRIIAATGAKIVLSTFWREFDEYLCYVLEREGVTFELAGRTPGAPATVEADRRRKRGDEIQEFLDACRSPGLKYVILDDREDAATSPEQRRRLVRTDAKVGLADADVDRAIAVLTGALCEEKGAGV